MEPKEIKEVKGNIKDQAHCFANIYFTGDMERQHFLDLLWDWYKDYGNEGKESEIKMVEQHHRQTDGKTDMGEDSQSDSQEKYEEDEAE